ncbi:hypothetical protein NX722_02565 [Endozoicomonas gorgoniicola]|uniref:Uncharacterized protein n=1 Tax=Endozoicomonas gorgoniicola TaxID=1234144 RepID=A0ABT3MQ95_9GAMM|nr:hypothetical protein [Endozoicomonas gorgoniicola]MCW7551544.1 hypothetical protein [Endozoicomonas gorgoniicola]
MATNGESARKWLEANQHKTSPERIRQIRDNIVAKLQRLDDTENEHDGLVEALDVMDAHLLQLEQQDKPEDHSGSSSDDLPPLDYSPLVNHHQEATVQLSPEEKQRRFQELLKKSRG